MALLELLQPQHKRDDIVNLSLIQVSYFLDSHKFCFPILILFLCVECRFKVVQLEVRHLSICKRSGQRPSSMRDLPKPAPSIHPPPPHDVRMLPHHNESWGRNVPVCWPLKNSVYLRFYFCNWSKSLEISGTTIFVFIIFPSLFAILFLLLI